MEHKSYMYIVGNHSAYKRRKEVSRLITRLLRRLFVQLNILAQVADKTTLLGYVLLYTIVVQIV